MGQLVEMTQKPDPDMETLQWFSDNCTPTILGEFFVAGKDEAFDLALAELRKVLRHETANAKAASLNLQQRRVHAGRRDAVRGCISLVERLAAPPDRTD